LLSDPNYIGTFDAFLERFVIAPFGHLILGATKRPKLFTDAHAAILRGGRFSCEVRFPKGKVFRAETRRLIPLREGGQTVLGYPSLSGGPPTRVTIPSGSKPVTELLRAGYYSQEQRKFWAYHLLEKRPHVCRILARRFPEIIVDEAQDTNEWLLECLKLLRTAGSRITLIGDPDQCIFEFNRASPLALSTLKECWGIKELPLSQSFRFNNQIALAVKHIGENPALVGCGDGKNEHHRPYVVRAASERFSDSIAGYKQALDRAGINESKSAIICRGHGQLESIRGEANYANLQGVTKDLAKASFFRDCRKDYKRAFTIVESAIRSIVGDSPLWKKVDEDPESEAALRFKLELWRFVKSKTGLAEVSASGSDWILRMRQSLGALIMNLGFNDAPNLGQKIRKTGLDDNQMKLPLLGVDAAFPAIRQETIHQVKGESIDAVLVLGSTDFWNSVIKSLANGVTSENRRLAYVAMTRARHLLVVGLPASHFDKHAEKWKGWGFSVL
jgi:hypothetical protein